MRILVTGSAGFVGQVLSKRLQEAGHDVIGIDIVHETVSKTFLNHDLTTPFTKLLTFDLCIHLASAVGGFLFNTRQDLIPTNDLINQTVLTLCQKAKCDRLIFFSTINVFEVCQTYKHDSLKQIDQKSAYALSKANAEMFFLSHFKNCMMIRPTNIFGSSQRRKHQTAGESHVIPDLLKKIEESDTITVFGDGSQIRNFVHVTDVAEFVATNLSFSGHRFFNLRSDITISIRELVNHLIVFRGKSITPQYDPSHMRHELFSISNFDLEIPIKHGWSPRVKDIQQGLSS